jgi:hypothetical protein
VAPLSFRRHALAAGPRDRVRTTRPRIPWRAVRVEGEPANAYFIICRDSFSRRLAALTEGRRWTGRLAPKTQMPTVYMLHNLSAKVRVCLSHVDDCVGRARRKANPALQVGADA